MSAFEILLEKVIAFCATIDKDISVITDEANEWASYCEEKIVVIPNDIENIRPVLYAGGKYFLHHICTAHHLNAYEYGENFLSLLHEIGHIYTTRWEPCNAFRERKQFERREGRFAKIETLDPFDYEFHRIYFDTIYEFNATAWAVRWVKAHPMEAKKWSELIGQSIGLPFLCARANFTIFSNFYHSPLPLSPFAAIILARPAESD